MPLPDWMGLIPLEACSVPPDDDDEAAGDALPLAALADDWLAAADVPGTVAALTAENTPTAASAPSAAPVVSRLSRRMASSRARILAWVGCLLSITVRKLEGLR